MANAANNLELRTCNFCGATKTIDLFRPRSRQCLDCRQDFLTGYEKDSYRREYKVAYMAAYRKTPKEMVKAAARQALHLAIASGKIDKPTVCSRCPSTIKIHGHHHDYSQPLDVIWLCTKCHVAEHKRMKLENPS